MEKFSEELQLANVVNNHSTMAYRKIVPQGQATAIALSASSSIGPTEFILNSNSVMNLAKSRLNFQLELPDAGGTSTNWIDANLASVISRLVCYDVSTGAVLCDVSNFEKFAALVIPAGTSYDEFKTKATSWQSTTYAQSLGIAATDSGPYACEDIQKSNSLVNVTHLNTATASTAGFNSYEGRKYLLHGIPSVGTTSNKTYVDASIPFSAFKFTALALDKMIVSPSNLILQVYWNAIDNFAWEGTSNSDPSAGASSVASGLLNNVSVSLATEQNLTIISKLTQQVNSGGISIPCAYSTVVRQAISSSTAHSYAINLSSGYGQRVLALITAPFSTGSTAINARNSHIRGTLTTYQTTMNGVAIKYQNGFDCNLLGQDYFYGNRDILKGSSVQSNQEYSVAEWLHCDSYFGTRPLHEVDQTEIDGYEIGSSTSSWSIQANLSAAAAATWVTVIIGQKMLSFTPQGVLIK